MRARISKGHDDAGISNAFGRRELGMRARTYASGEAEHRFKGADYRAIIVEGVAAK